MNTRDISNKTAVYSESVIETASLCWPISDVDVVSIKTVEMYPLDEPVLMVPLPDGHEIDGLSMMGDKAEGCAFVEWMHADELPIEFFSHQLLDYDPFDKDDVSRFVSEWGMLFSPQRNATFCLKDWGVVWQLAQTGIAETWNLEEVLSAADVQAEEEQLMQKLNAGELTQESIVGEIERARSEAYRDSIGLVISLMEASTTLYVLQETVRTMFQIIENKGWASDELDRVLNVLSAGSCNPHIVQSSKYWYRGGISNLGTGLRYRGQLTSAICNQIIESINDPALWRKCACDGCNRIFKRKQSKSEKHDSDSIYCSDKCMERQKKRNQRAAAKARIKH